MQDEIHQPVRIIKPVPPRIVPPARLMAPPSAAHPIDSEALTIRPPSVPQPTIEPPQLEEVHELEEVHDELPQLEEVHDEEVDRHNATTAPPPSETKERMPPGSGRDAMLARFLADAPISGTTVPPDAIEESRPTVVPKKT